MPTARGWTIMLTGFTLWGSGRAFGAQPLEQLGFALVALVVLAVLVVNFGKHDLRVARRVTPERSGAGRPVQVTLTLTNEGRGHAPLLLLRDELPVEVSGQARFAIRGVEPGGARETSYVVRAQRRGRYEVGPLGISYVDPFGLARVRTEVLDPSTFLVYPRMEQLVLPRDMGEQRNLAVSAMHQPVMARGEEFFTLREFVEGDDLRRIHWRATAKRDRPMIRQEETPWHTRATILLDDRREVHDGVGDLSSFERSVEAAASLCDMYHRSGYSWRLTGAHHIGLPSGRGSEHRHGCLDLLAEIEASPAGAAGDALLIRLADVERGVSPEGTLVLITGRPDPAMATAVSRCRRRFRNVIVLLFPAHRFGPGATRDRWDGERQTNELVRRLARSGVRSVVLGPEEGLAQGWMALASSSGMGGDSWARKAAPV